MLRNVFIGQLIKTKIAILFAGLFIVFQSCSILPKIDHTRMDARKTVRNCYRLVEEYTTLGAAAAEDSVITQTEADALNSIEINIDSIANSFYATHENRQVLDDMHDKMSRKPKYSKKGSKLLEASMLLFDCEGFELLLE